MDRCRLDYLHYYFKDMITDVFLYVFGFFINTIASISSFISQDWHVWPQPLLDGLTYFCNSLMKLDFLFPVGDLLLAVLFLISFLSVYYSVKILLMIINWARGAGSIDI